MEGRGRLREEVEGVEMLWEGGWGSSCGIRQILKNAQGMELWTQLARQELTNCLSA